MVRSSTNLAAGGVLVGQLDADPVEAAHYRRYQYYTRSIINHFFPRGELCDKDKHEFKLKENIYI